MWVRKIALSLQRQSGEFAERMTARRSRLQGKNLYGLQRSFRAPKEIRMRVAYRRDNFKFRNHSFYRSRGLRTCGFFMEVLRTVMPRGASRNLTKDEITSRPDLQLWSACNFDALELARYQRNARSHFFNIERIMYQKFS